MKTSYLFPIAISLWVSANAQDTATSGTPAIDPANIVESTTYDLGDRLLTVQGVTEEVLPTPPPKVEAPPVQQNVFQTNPTDTSLEQQTLMLGATVFRSKTGPARTLVTYHPPGAAAGVTFWSSADWSLLANVGPVTGADGKTWDMMLMWSAEELDDTAAGDGKTDDPLVIPAFPAGRASYKVIDGILTPQMRAPIDLFHATYDSQYQKLKAAYQALETARLLREAELKARPPEPQDVVIQYRLLEPGQMDPK